LNTISNALQKRGLAVGSADCVQHVFPLVMVQLGLATAVFWAWSLWAERSKLPEESAAPPEKAAEAPAFRVNLLKAAVPLLPLALLFMTALPQRLFAVPRAWLVGLDERPELYSTRLIGAAMLVGVVAATLLSPRALPGVARAFFEGAGYAFTHIIALIVAASCFGKGVEQIGLAGLLGGLIESFPALLLPSAGSLPLAFGWVSGSGMAATQSLYDRFFAEPALELGIDPVHVGAVVSIAAAAGRTMSPVAAVTLMCASMTGTTPLQLSRRVAGPLLAGTAVMVLVAMLMAAA
jgi:DcuC family C4-dicarboxylate transporter